MGFNFVNFLKYGVFTSFCVPPCFLRFFSAQCESWTWMIRLDINSTTFAYFVTLGCVSLLYSRLCVRLSELLPIVWFPLDLCLVFVNTRIRVESTLSDWGRWSESMNFGLVHHWDSCRIHTLGLRPVECFHDVWFCWLWDLCRIHPSRVAFGWVFSLHCVLIPVLFVMIFVMVVRHTRVRVHTFVGWLVRPDLPWYFRKLWSLGLGWEYACPRELVVGWAWVG